MDIEQLRDILRHDITTVVFTKKDGSKREMTCTTIPDYLPGPSTNTSVVSPDVVTVWDLENRGWRSFRFDSIISVETDYFAYPI